MIYWGKKLKDKKCLWASLLTWKEEKMKHNQIQGLEESETSGKYLVMVAKEQNKQKIVRFETK